MIRLRIAVIGLVLVLVAVAGMAFRWQSDGGPDGSTGVSALTINPDELAECDASDGEDHPEEPAAQ